MGTFKAVLLIELALCLVEFVGFGLGMECFISNFKDLSRLPAIPTAAVGPLFKKSVRISLFIKDRYPRVKNVVVV